MTLPPLLPILLSVACVSLVSLSGAALLSLHDRLLRAALPVLVSFSTGALLGNVFLHLLPETIETVELTTGMLLVLAGVVVSFVLEKFIHWRHCHSLDCEDHVHPVGVLTLLGDGVHNIVDGALIATAYYVSVPLGIATTIAVVLHEIPQELGDFSILLHSGYSRGRALLFNLLSGLTAFLGVFLIMASGNASPDIISLLLPLAAGNFLYIAGSDLIPELHKQTRAKMAFVQLFCMIAGIALMYAISSGDHHVHVNDADHADVHEEREQHMEIDGVRE